MTAKKHPPGSAHLFNFQDLWDEIYTTQRDKSILNFLFNFLLTSFSIYTLTKMIKFYKNLSLAKRAGLNFGLFQGLCFD